MATRLGFPRERRLRKRRQFLAVQGGGRRLGGTNFLFFAHPRHDAADSAVPLGARFGITVTRKVGNAVIRNRIKRMVREGCRHAAGLFPSKLDVVIVARSSAATAATSDVVAELADLARRLGSRSTR